MRQTASHRVVRAVVERVTAPGLGLREVGVGLTIDEAVGIKRGLGVVGATGSSVADSTGSLARLELVGVGIARVGAEVEGLDVSSRDEVAIDGG